MQRPYFLEHFINLHLVRHGENLLMGDLSVVQLDRAIGESCDHRIVRNHYDRPALLMEISQLFQNELLVSCVEVSSGLVGKNDAGIVDQRACDTYSLLL